MNEYVVKGDNKLTVGIGWDAKKVNLKKKIKIAIDNIMSATSEDNGIGIPQSDIPLVCKKSFTGENGRKHAKSTGMGLYIIDNLCRQLGHKLDITSKVDEYTDVSIVFGHNDIYKIG